MVLNVTDLIVFMHIVGVGIKNFKFFMIDLILHILTVPPFLPS